MNTNEPAATALNGMRREMNVRDAINYAHDLVVKCGKLDLPHKMEAHNAIDKIDAAYKREIFVERNLGTDEIDMAVAAKDAEIAKLHELVKELVGCFENWIEKYPPSEWSQMGQSWQLIEETVARAKEGGAE